MSSSRSRIIQCAACNILNRICNEQCVFAPYFPPDQPHRFEIVHRVFGATFAENFLIGMPAGLRENTVNNLVKKAEAELQKIKPIMATYTPCQGQGTSQQVKMPSLMTACGACKVLHRKCDEQCVFCPYFPPERIHKFECVNKVYGHKKAAALLYSVPDNMREKTANSLVYEAEARIKDPVHGCLGFIRYLQERIIQLQSDLHATKQDLAAYKGCQGHPGQLCEVEFVGEHSHQQQQMHHQQQSMRLNRRFDGAGSFSGQHYQEIYEVEVTSEQDLVRNLEPHLHQRQNIQHQQHRAGPLGQHDKQMEQHQHHDQHQQPRWIDLFNEFDRRYGGAEPSGPQQPQLQERLPSMQHLPFKKRLMQQLRQLQNILQQENQPSQPQQQDDPQPPPQQNQP